MLLSRVLVCNYAILRGLTIHRGGRARGHPLSTQVQILSTKGDLEIILEDPSTEAYLRVRTAQGIYQQLEGWLGATLPGRQKALETDGLGGAMN